NSRRRCTPKRRGRPAIDPTQCTTGCREATAAVSSAVAPAEFRMEVSSSTPPKGSGRERPTVGGIANLPAPKLVPALQIHGPKLERFLDDTRPGSPGVRPGLEDDTGVQDRERHVRDVRLELSHALLGTAIEDRQRVLIPD